MWVQLPTLNRLGEISIEPCCSYFKLTFFLAYWGTWWTIRQICSKSRNQLRHWDLKSQQQSILYYLGNLTSFVIISRLLLIPSFDFFSEYTGGGFLVSCLKGFRNFQTFLRREECLHRYSKPTGVWTLFILESL